MQPNLCLSSGFEYTGPILIILLLVKFPFILCKTYAWGKDTSFGPVEWLIFDVLPEFENVLLEKQPANNQDTEFFISNEVWKMKAGKRSAEPKLWRMSK